MILNSLEEKKLKEQFLKITIFDYIIGNTDRHQNNWAVMRGKSGTLNIAPLYDNGSSLCALVPDSKLKSYLGNDLMLLNSLIVTKSQSWVRIDGTKKNKALHIDIVKYLKDNYYDETIEFVKNAVRKLNDDKIKDILNEVREYISDNRSQLIRIYLNKKIKDLRLIYGL
jgi:hypothetical protein